MKQPPTPKGDDFREMVDKVDDGAYQAGKLVYELRMVSGLSQREFAKKCGVQQSSISRAESLTYYVTIRYLEKICKANNVKLVLNWRI